MRVGSYRTLGDSKATAHGEAGVLVTSFLKFCYAMCGEEFPYIYVIECSMAHLNSSEADVTLRRSAPNVIRPIQPVACVSA